MRSQKNCFICCTFKKRVKKGICNRSAVDTCFIQVIIVYRKTMDVKRTRSIIRRVRMQSLYILEKANKIRRKTLVALGRRTGTPDIQNAINLCCFATLGTQKAQQNTGKIDQQLAVITIRTQKRVYHSTHSFVRAMSVKTQRKQGKDMQILWGEHTLTLIHPKDVFENSE